MIALEGTAKRVRIYLNEGDLVGHTAAHVAVVEFLRRENAAGATVFRTIEGFGGSGQIHTQRLVELSGALPIVIEWIDAPERVDRLLQPLKQMVSPGLITVEETQVALYSPERLRRVSSHLVAEEIMSRDIASVAPDAPVHEVVERMRGQLFRAVPVLERGVLVGIITNSDLVTRGGLSVRLELLATLSDSEQQAELARLASSEKTAGEIMTPAPLSVRTTTSLTEVADLMVHRRLKRLPVLDAQDMLAGMISRLDLLRTVTEGIATEEAERREIGLNGGVPVSRTMRHDVPTVYPETPVAEVMQAVIATRLNRVLVVDHERHVLGLITDSELLERVTPSARPGMIRSLMQRLPFAHRDPDLTKMEQHAKARVAQDLMSTDVTVVSQAALLRDAIMPMIQGKQKLVAVVDDHKQLVGVLDRADILRGIADRSDRVR